MQVQKTINRGASNKLQRYTIDILQRSILGGLASENLVKTVIQKKCTHQLETGFVFELLVTKRKQSNVEGLRAIENDLAFLQKKLVVQTNLQGLPTSILNLEDISEQWKDYQKNFKRAHKAHGDIDPLIEETTNLLNNDEIFTENFIDSEIGTLFFPPIYNILGTKGETVKQKKELGDFFEAASLPLLLATTLNEVDTVNEKVQILRQGKIDKETFDHYAVRKQFRKMADNLQLAIPVTAKYIETYDLHTEYEIQHAGQLLSVQIPSLFSYNQIVRVTALK